MRDRNGRFPPGCSGNPGGRPVKYPETDPSLLTLLNEIVTIKQNGVERQLTTDEGMLLRAVQEAVTRQPGVRAMRIVLKAIVEREVARHERNPRDRPKHKSQLVRERDSDNAFEAMCLLGIAEPNPAYPEGDVRTRNHDGTEEPINYHRILLTRWAVEAAQARKPEYPDDSDFDMTLRSNMVPAKAPFLP